MYEQVAKCNNCNNGDALYVINDGDMLEDCYCSYCKTKGVFPRDLYSDEDPTTLPQIKKNGSEFTETDFANLPEEVQDTLDRYFDRRPPEEGGRE